MWGQRPVRSLIRAVSDAAGRWGDGDFPPRVRSLAAIVERTGYSEPVVEYALDRLFSSISNGALESAIVQELGSLDTLDGFVERDGVRVRALPVGRVCVISSRTTIGVSLVSAAFAICAKCDVLVKDREDRLVSSFFRTLLEELPELGERARAQTWRGEDEARDLQRFDAVVAFGSRPAIERIRSTTDPEARFIAYGPRTSVGYVTREALDGRPLEEIAFGAARDALLYDTEGCLSLRTIFVERGGSVTPDAFFSILTRAIEHAGIEFPAMRLDPHRAADVASAYSIASFRSANGSGGVASDASHSYVATFEPGLGRAPEFLPRTIAVHPIDGPRDAMEYVRKHGLALEGWSVDSARDDVIEAALAAGAVRIAPFGTLQHPPLASPHGGRPRIAEFVRWVSDER
ncbi:MAG TPA: acyl-CoA reductase [Candidatus Tumulicola sp.]